MSDGGGKIENVVLYTCITRNYDPLRPVPTQARCICFHPEDEPVDPCPPWELVPVHFGFGNAELRSRIPKALPDMYLPVDTDVSIWTDAAIEWHKSPVWLLGLLDKHEMGLPAHPWRDCAYEEEGAVIDAGRVNPEVSHAQMASYRERGFPAHHGLAETNVIVRRHTRRVLDVCHAWWAETTRWTHHDQLSWDYVCWAHGMEYALLTRDIRRCGWAKKWAHAKGREQPA